MSCIGQFTQRVDNFGVIKPSSQWIDSLMRWTVLRKQTTSIVFYLNRNRYCNIRYWNKQAAVASTNPQLPRCDLPNDYSINRWFMWCKITIIKFVLNYLWIQTNGNKKKIWHIKLHTDAVIVGQSVVLTSQNTPYICNWGSKGSYTKWSTIIWGNDTKTAAIWIVFQHLSEH
jgi:hypothetical protein